MSLDQTVSDNQWLEDGKSPLTGVVSLCRYPIQWHKVMFVPKPCISARLYCFRQDAKEAYGGENDLVTIAAMSDYFLETMKKQQKLLLGTDYCIAGAWADGKSRMLDVFAFDTGGNWFSNPEVRNAVFRDGKKEKTDVISCETTLLILGKESELRRSSQHIDEYFERFPELKEYMPSTSCMMRGK